MKKIITSFIIVIVVIALYLNRSTLRELVFRAQKPAVPAPISYEMVKKEIETTSVDHVNTTTTQENTNSNTNKTATEQKIKAVPRPVLLEINLAVPFRAQAPFGNWAEPYENACEEASLIMVDYYLRGSTLSRQQMKNNIDKLIAWQIKNWGEHKDLPIEKVKELATILYPYKLELIPDLTIEKIKEQLRLGRPIIVPSAGRELGNPNFRGLGPIYHMLVIKGYTKEGKIITNDPGTRNGADYVYDPNILIAAIQNWDGSGPNGPKKGLAMYK